MIECATAARSAEDVDDEDEDEQDEEDEVVEQLVPLLSDRPRWRSGCVVSNCSTNSFTLRSTSISPSVGTAETVAVDDAGTTLVRLASDVGGDSTDSGVGPAKITPDIISLVVTVSKANYFQESRE